MHMFLYEIDYFPFAHLEMTQFLADRFMFIPMVLLTCSRTVPEKFAFTTLFKHNITFFCFTVCTFMGQII